MAETSEQAEPYSTVEMFSNPDVNARYENTCTQNRIQEQHIYTQLMPNGRSSNERLYDVPEIRPKKKSFKRRHYYYQLTLTIVAIFVVINLIVSIIGFQKLDTLQRTATDTGIKHERKESISNCPVSHQKPDENLQETVLSIKGSEINNNAIWIDFTGTTPVPLYKSIVRVFYDGNLIPGEMRPVRNTAHFVFDDNICSSEHFQILTLPKGSFHWVKPKPFENLSTNAYQGGIEAKTKEILYICMTTLNNMDTDYFYGWTKQNDDCCHVPNAGSTEAKVYQVMVMEKKEISY